MQCCLVEKNPHLCFYFFSCCHAIAIWQLSKRWKEKMPQWSSSVTRTPCLLPFLFKSVFFLFSPSIRSVYWRQWQLDDVESEQLFLEIVRFIASSPRNISRLNISLVCLFPLLTFYCTFLIDSGWIRTTIWMTFLRPIWLNCSKVSLSLGFWRELKLTQEEIFSTLIPAKKEFWNYFWKTTLRSKPFGFIKQEPMRVLLSTRL